MPMTHLKGLSKLQAEINPRYLGAWTTKIGAYMLNFTGIELISYKYLNALEVTREDFDRNLKKLLPARIDRIVELVQRSEAFDEVNRQLICRLWERVKELAKWRNRIAHNPVLPTWKPGSNSQTDPPDLIGIPDMRQLKGRNVSDSISLDGINKLINETLTIAKELNNTI